MSNFALDAQLAEAEAEVDSDVAPKRPAGDGEPEAVPVLARTPQALAEIAGSQHGFTREEIELLARVVHAEARGEPYIGQVAVCAVVLNRLEDPRFPGEVEDVVYEPKAFTAVSDGQIDLKPNSQAYLAVADALRGVDPSGGALFYYNPKMARCAWIRQRPIIKRLGRHVFAR